MRIYFIAILSTLSLFVFGQVSAQIAPPKVDLRVELMSIVFRLADSKEYSANDNVKYVQRIHEHFDQFVDHPLIKYIRQIRESNGIGYDAVMSLAVYLEQPPSLNPIIPFTADVPDKRWGIEVATKFVVLLKQFYKDAKCNAFFQSNAAYYKLAEHQFDAVIKKLDVGWYYKYYGKKPAENFNLIVGLGNGGNNFGPHINLPNKTKKVYAIIGCWSFDSTNKPIFDHPSYLSTIVHEFNHSFINYLSDLYKDSLKNAGDIIFNKESAKMKNQAYPNWNIMMNEALVRASVIRYLTTHNRDTSIADKELKEQLGLGFVWMGDFAKILGLYETNRKTYPTLESYMPQIVHFYNEVAPKMNEYENDYLQHCAQIISIEPFKESDSTISPNLTEIRFNFNKKLDGVRYFFGPGRKGMEHYPKQVDFKFSNDNKSLIMQLKLEPNKDYQINMVGNLMKTDDGYTVKRYLLNFKTTAQ